MVSIICKQPSAERYLAKIFSPVFSWTFRNFLQCIKKTFRKFYFSKVAGFYRSSHRSCSVKGVVREVFAKCTGKHLCQRLYFNKVTGLRAWHKCFPLNLAKILRGPSLQKTSGRLLLVLAFQKQPPEVFYEKRCSWKFRKIYRKTPVVCEIFKNTIFTEHLWTTTSGFSLQVY